MVHAALDGSCVHGMSYPVITWKGLRVVIANAIDLEYGKPM
jgi:hypothetical protein